jgi:hypothetical protein
LYEQRRHTALAILCVITLAVNLEILWVKKMSQFRERGEPSELLKQAAAEADGSVTVSCAPLPDFVVESVLKSVGTSVVFEESDAQKDRVQQDPSCFKVEFRNRAGQVIRESRRLGTERHGTFY